MLVIPGERSKYHGEMIDLLIYEDGNGGNVSVENGDIKTTGSLANQAYLAHFGGNVEANTTGDEQAGEIREDWWGNSFLNNDKDSQMNSNLERALNNNALSSQGRSEIEKQAKNDLKYLSEMADITVSATITGNDKIKISDKLDQVKNDFTWNATKDELIEEIII